MYSKKVRKIAISLYNKFNIYRKVASLLNISKSIIHYWINYKYISHKKVIPLNKIQKFIKSLLIKDNYITIKNVTKMTNKKFKLNLSKSFIYTTIKKKLNYSFKKITKKNFSKNINDLIKKKKNFKKKYSNYKNIICIDETYVHSNIHSKYGWALNGKRLIHYVKSNPIKYSIIVAISCNGIQQYLISKNNINKDIFKKFIVQLCHINKNKLFLMDNVSFHKSKDVTSIIDKTSNKAIFIPPYSPELNPIEEVFSIFKRCIANNKLKNTYSKIIFELRKLKNTNFENYYKYSFRK